MAHGTPRALTRALSATCRRAARRRVEIGAAVLRLSHLRPPFFLGPFVLNGSPPIAVVLDSTNPGREPYRTMNKKLNEGDYSSKHLVVHMNDKLIGSRARLVCSHTFVCAHAREYIRI